MLLFGVSFLIISCQKDDDFSRKETFNEASAKEINIKTIIGQQIPKSITNYLKDKTENTLQFNITNKKIEPLTVQTIASRGVNLEIGTINTSKSVVVINPTNTKYTFEMVNNDVNTKHNLVVIDLGTEIINYYISFKPEPSWSSTHDITKDMRFFTGDIVFYNTHGVETGVLKIANGLLEEELSKVYDPCFDQYDDNQDDSTNNTNNGTSGGGGSGTNTGNGSNSTNVGGSGGSGSSGANTELPFSEMCEYTVGQECSAGGGHTSSANCTSGDGWSVTFSLPCGSLGERNTSSDCVGDVGILINTETHKSNCEDLHKFSTNPYSQNEFISQEADVSDTKEKGYILKHVPFNPGFEAQPIEAGSDCGEIRFPINNVCYGFMHTHPTGCEGGTYPMFFEGDLYTLYKMSQTYNATSPVDNSIFSAYMTVEGNHYAMKIKDVNKFNALGDIYNNKKKKEKFIARFKRAFKKINNNDEPTQNELAEAFLKFINETYDLGISVYRSSHDDVNYDPNLPLDQQTSNWTELILDENNNLDYNNC